MSTTKRDELDAAGIQPGEVVCTDKTVVNPEAARVRVSGKTATQRGPRAKIAVPVEKQREMTKTMMHSGDRRDVRPRGEPREVEIPTSPDDREIMIVDDTRQTDGYDLGDMCAPAPPPGYRYTLSGKLVPLATSRIPLTEQRGRDLFLEVLEITGSCRAAADACGIYGLETVQNYMAKDPEFEKAYDVAMHRHRDVLYAAAFQRAVHGVKVPIVGGQFKDQIVGYERKYADNVMMLMLKRHFPEFRDAAASKINIDNSEHKTIRLDGVDMSRLNRDQRDKLRAFLESVGTDKALPAGEEKKP